VIQKATPSKCMPLLHVDSARAFLCSRRLLLAAEDDSRIDSKVRCVNGSSSPY